MCVESSWYIKHWVESVIKSCNWDLFVNTTAVWGKGVIVEDTFENGSPEERLLSSQDLRCYFASHRSLFNSLLFFVLSGAYILYFPLWSK